MKTAIIIGGGPAGLTAALELLEKTDIKPIVLERDNVVGGISRTVNFKGNRIDIGGHRFFSKSDEVMDFWKKVLPNDFSVRNRLSRILYGGKFYDYPVTISWKTFSNLGLARVFMAGFSYLKAKIMVRKERSLEDFYINRFGEELYKTFFRDYTKKVWGVGADKIDPSWGEQRVKGVSLWKAIKGDKRETSFINKFLYPKYGPGQMWETAARLIKKRGGKIIFGEKVVRIKNHESRIMNVETNTKKIYKADYFISSMPIKELIGGMDGIPKSVREVAEGLIYRDFITVGVLAKKLKINISDNWIYIQEPFVKMGRIQFFNNWSRDLLRDSKNVWMGTEYFGNEGDALFNKSDKEISDLAISELLTLGFINKNDVLDTVVIRMPKTYPAYFGTYSRFNEVREFLDRFENLFLVGRNGQHRYNNQDHSMMTAMAAVSNIISGRKDKSNIWEVNTEKEYLEKK